MNCVDALPSGPVTALGFDRVTPAELALNDLVIGHFMYQHVSKMRSAKFLMTFLRDGEQDNI